MGVLEVLDRKQSLAKEEARITQRYEQSTGTFGGDDPNASFITRLDSHISTCWQAAKTAKESGIEAQMLEDLRQREMTYSVAKLQAIRRQGGSEVYMGLTNAKCRAAESWIKDILLPAGERPFTAKPSPVPELSPDIKETIYGNTMKEVEESISMGIYPSPQQVHQRARDLYDESMNRLKAEAKTRAARMEDEIDDLFVQGMAYDALDEMIVDLVALPAAFIKGPVIQQVLGLNWKTDATGQSVPEVIPELTPMFYSPSPFDMYPAPDSKDIDDGYLFERIPLRRAAIHSMIGVPGYDEKRIRAALSEYARNGFNLQLSSEQERRDLEQNRDWQTTPDHAIDALEFHGTARGEWLLEWGISPKLIDDPDKDYEITALKIGRFVVRAVINADPLHRRPYVKASYDAIKGQFWGRGLTRLIRDLQDLCNAIARAISNNAGIASGPIVEVEVDRLAEGEDITQLYPWRIFQTKASRTTPAPAVRFHNPDMVASQLLEVYRYFSGLADIYSGVPSYEQGVNPTTGAAGTASGLSMLMSATSRQVRRVMGGIDKMIKGMVNRAHTHIMLYVDKPEIKGDLDLEPRGVASLVVKEQQAIRKAELLAQTGNPIDMEIIGPAGRAELLREVFKAQDIDPENVVPTRDEMIKRAMQMAAQASQQQQIEQQAMAAQAGGAPPPPGGPQAQIAPAPPPQTLDQAGNPAGGTDTRLF